MSWTTSLGGHSYSFADLRELLAKATPESILSEDREFDRKMAAVEARFAQLPPRAAATRVDWAAVIDGGEPQSDDAGARADKYLAGK